MKNRTLLMIPGPVEFEPKVLAAMGEPTTSHLAPAFIEAFGQSLQNLRQVFESPSGQPLVLAGSGTLAMDCAGANLIEPGDKALVVDTGYFSERFAVILERYGGQVTRISTSPGNRPSLEQIKSALEADTFKLMEHMWILLPQSSRRCERSLLSGDCMGYWLSWMGSVRWRARS